MDSITVMGVSVTKGALQLYNVAVDLDVELIKSLYKELEKSYRPFSHCVQSIFSALLSHKEFIAVKVFRETVASLTDTMASNSVHWYDGCIFNRYIDHDNIEMITRILAHDIKPSNTHWYRQMSSDMLKVFLADGLCIKRALSSTIAGNDYKNMMMLLDHGAIFTQDMHRKLNLWYLKNPEMIYALIVLADDAGEPIDINIFTATLLHDVKTDNHMLAQTMLNCNADIAYKKYNILKYVIRKKRREMLKILLSTQLYPVHVIRSFYSKDPTIKQLLREYGQSMTKAAR